MQLSINIIRNICTYLIEQRTKFLDWIQQDKIDFYLLNHNKNASQYIYENFSKFTNIIDWELLSEREDFYAIKILQQHPDNIDWEALSHNCCALDLIESNFNKICWVATSSIKLDIS